VLVNPQILKALEAESIEIMRETAASYKQPVMMYSIGKDSSVLLHLAKKAFYPAPIPFPVLHIDTTWKFKEMIAFRDQAVAKAGAKRRDEEKSRAKERIFSVREAGHKWDPRNQRPELWHTYNTRLAPGQTMRVFPISDWTELDIWAYIMQEDIEVNPLYFAKARPVVKRGHQLIMVDDDRYPLNPNETTQLQQVRFRTLGCYPITAAVESNAQTLAQIVEEVFAVKLSERATRLMDGADEESMEKKKTEGYF